MYIYTHISQKNTSCMNIFQKHARGVLLRKFRVLGWGPDL